jgi:UDP-3-O-[3-hydroxymyristoyl] N-acetylglucosamine deacetylase
MPWQHTIAKSGSLKGIGLHTGEPVSVTLHPAEPDHGVVFLRADRDDAIPIPALVEHVVDTQLATTLGRDGQRIATVEHLVAALSAEGIDNLRVEVHGPEVPILDGSSMPWLTLLTDLGRTQQAEAQRYLRVLKAVEVSDGDRFAILRPADQLEIDISVDYPHPMLGAQQIVFLLDRQRFRQEIGWARTFGFLAQVEAMRAAGLARGGSLENALVFDDTRLLNEEGLQAPDEPLRHKVLDAIGDLALVGMPLLGRLVAQRPGHALHHALLNALLQDATAWTVESSGNRVEFSVSGK